MCTITRLYDQSPERNDLGIEPIGGNGSADVGAIANALPVVVDGHQVYGVSVQAGVGYRNDVTRGVPTGSQPQGAYMVTSGQHTDPVCCFDFGNAETSNTDTGNGHMDAVYFGNLCWFRLLLAEPARGSRRTWKTGCSPAATARTRATRATARRS